MSSQTKIMKSLSALRYLNTTETATSIKTCLYSITGKPIYFVSKRVNSTERGRSSSDSSSSESDNEATKAKSASEMKNKDTLIKLNNLLKQLLEQDVVAKSSELDLAKPTNKRSKTGARTENPKPRSDQVEMLRATKNVALELGGDVKDTESELLMKLLNTMKPAQTTQNLGDILKGMKIDRTAKNAEQSRADQIRNILQHVHSKQKVEGARTDLRVRKTPLYNQKQEITLDRVDLFGSDPLGIFTSTSELREVPENTTWQKLRERDLKLAVTHPPANYFQQMILWTEQGKVWKFPIDNEQGLEEEKAVSFAEHVFLEEHLEPWCPPKGPIRHFMELVCVGLSKNFYLTVKAKKEHIYWFRNYFEDKKKLLQEVGAFPIENQKQVE